MKTTYQPKETTKIYTLSDQGKQITWKQWLKMGGCRLSGCVSSNVGKAFHLPEKHWGDITLGQMQEVCIVAGREISGFAVRHLNKPEIAVIEYDFAISRERIASI